MKDEFESKFIRVWKWIVNVMQDVRDMFVNDEWFEIVIET